MNTTKQHFSQQGVGPNLALTDEEKKLLELEGVTLPTDTHLTKVFMCNHLLVSGDPLDSFFSRTYKVFVL